MGMRRHIYLRKLQLHKGAVSVCALLLLGLLLGGLELGIRPVMRRVARDRAGALAEQTASRAVQQELASEDYGELLRVSRDSSGQVTSLELDTVKSNQLKTRVTSRLLRELAQQGRQRFCVPLGTLVGSGLFAGRGPELTFETAPTGMVESRFESRFEEAGINQVLHQVLLVVETRVATLAAGSREEITVRSEFLVAQTVITGEVPSVVL